MRRLSFCFAAAAIALQLIPLAVAQQASVTTVPNLIRYGGTLKNADGAAVAASTVGVTFAVYGQQEGGAAVWMETQNVTTDGAGNYSVLLGATTATGLPGDLFSLQEQRWLGVQVQGEPEQARVLMVSVPYALKAHEAETLGGRSVSDFVLANGATSSTSGGTTGQSTPAASISPGSSGSVGNNTAASDGPTNFSGSTTDQIVGVTQSSTGAGLVASAPTLGIKGTATDPTNTAYGVQGVATGAAGVGLIGTATSTTGFTYGLRGTSSSASGTGVRGIAVATSGSTIGVSGYVDSSTGTAGVFDNAAGGNILVGQNNGAAKFTVNSSGNVNAAGGFTGSGTGITGITFSQLTGQLANSQLAGAYSGAVTLSNPGNSFSGTSFTGGSFTGSGSGLTGIPFANLTGTLASAQFSGTYSNAVMLTSTSNVFYGSGANLTGLAPAMGSASYIQNQNTAPQKSANFDISGNGTLGSYLTAYGGVSGIIKSATGNAVFGSATTTTGAAVGVSGQSMSPTGTAVYGTNMATSGNAYGVSGQTASTTGTGVYGANTATSGQNYGVAGYTASTTQNASGVFGQATPGSGATNGVYGLTNSTDVNADGVYGVATPATGSGEGVVGVSFGTNGTGVWGKANSTNSSGTTYGVYGQTASPNGYGVYGIAQSTDTSGLAYGVYGQSSIGSGVLGITYGNNGNSQFADGGVIGVAQTNGSVFSQGVAGINLTATGHSNGVYGQAASPEGAAGFFDNTAGGYILFGRVNGGPGLFTVDGSGNGSFAGNVQVGGGGTFGSDVTVTGNLSVTGTLSKGGGSFKIDDPIDPANKTLSHSFVESPDMMNIYNGNVTTDKRGLATVLLPNYFEALNRDFRYQLTVIGQFAQAIIAKEIDGGRFTIRTNKPGVKVSWQVTGIRQDAWANAHRIPNEQDKPVEQRGMYLYPELYGAAADKQINAAMQH